ncbi:hypothetical protein ACHAXR_010934 [Thalassiosira sp. AJA248-18]
MSSTHWNILSSWSKAGVGTSIVLELKKPSSSPPSDSSHQYSKKKPSPNDNNKNQPTSSKKSSPRIAFDIGATPCFDDAIPAKYVFVSHGHVDHVGALFSHARAHAVTCGGAAPTYFIPAPLLPQIEQCRDAMSLLDASNMHPEGGGRTKSLIKMNLVPVHPGDEIPLKGINYGSKTSFFMRAFKVDHAGHPALGYAISSRTTSGLKPEYQNLDGTSIRDLVKSGISIKANPMEKIEIGYTGDTCARGLMRKTIDNGCDQITTKKEGKDKAAEKTPSLFGIEQLFQAELLLCELTFIDSSDDEQQRSKAGERGHIHINDIDVIFLSHKKLFSEESDNTTIKSSMGVGESDTITTPDITYQQPERIVFYHLSAKYQPARRALDLIAEGLPSQIRDRSYIAVASMLSQEEKLCDDALAKLIQPSGCISLADYLAQKGTLV